MSRSDPHRNLGHLAWPLAALATGAGAVLLGVLGIWTSGAVLGSVPGQTGILAGTALGAHAITVMVASIVLLIAVAAVAALALPVLIGWRPTVWLQVVAILVGFGCSAVLLWASIPKDFDRSNPTVAWSQRRTASALHNFWFLAGPVMLGFALCLALLLPVYRYAVDRAAVNRAAVNRAAAGTLTQRRTR